MPSAPRLDERAGEILVGSTVRLHHYVPGYYPRGILLRLWEMIEEDGAALDIFYDHLSEKVPDSPVDTRAEISEVLSYFADPKKVIVFVDDPGTNDLMGAFWLTEIVPGFRATVNLFFRKRYRGRQAFEAGRRFRDYATDVLGFKSLWGITPWKHSVAMGRWLGMKTVAVLPHFHLVNGVPMDSYILKLER